MGFVDACQLVSQFVKVTGCIVHIILDLGF